MNAKFSKRLYAFIIDFIFIKITFALGANKYYN